VAELRLRQGRLEEAESLFLTVLEKRRRVLGPTHPTTATVAGSLAEVKLAQRKYGEAEPLLREALAVQEKTSPENWRRYYTQAMLGATLAGLGKPGQALPLLRVGYDGMVRRRDSIPYERRQSLGEIEEWIRGVRKDGDALR
jgi:hypothetical protein